MNDGRTAGWMEKINTDGSVGLKVLITHRHRFD